MFKNSHLRLLMTVSGFQRLGPASEETRDSAWIIPGEVSAEHLKDTLHYINQAEFSPPTFEEGVVAENQLKRKTVARKKAAFDDDGEEDGIGFLDDDLFQAGGPTVRKAIDDPAKPKKTKQRRKRRDGEPDQDVIDEKARKRQEREREKARKIKSALYVKEGDDEFDSEEDEAFFSREREIAARAEKAAKSAALGNTETVAAAKPRKRKSEALLEESDDDGDEDEDEDDDLGFAKKILSSQEDGGESETDDTPVDVSDGEARKKRRLSVEDEEEDGVNDDEDVAMIAPVEKAGEAAGLSDDDGEDEVPVPVRRPRVRGGFVIDSDDDD